MSGTHLLRLTWTAACSAGLLVQAANWTHLTLLLPCLLLLLLLLLSLVLCQAGVAAQAAASLVGGVHDYRAAPPVAAAAWSNPTGTSSPHFQPPAGVPGPAAAEAAGLVLLLLPIMVVVVQLLVLWCWVLL
jgi:hypothetical protein